MPNSNSSVRREAKQLLPKRRNTGDNLKCERDIILFILAAIFINN